MKFLPTTISEKKQMLKDTYVFQLKPKPFDFMAGQYVFLQNPSYKPEEPHPFSIASSPIEPAYLEFCIKTYGQWTKELCKKSVGDVVNISEPQGNFVWDKTIQDIVFLLGGIGISPVMSMLRTIERQLTKPKSITILYGNRTPETIAYRDDLERLQSKLALNIIHVFSHLEEYHGWNGYRGFITSEIIEKESRLETNPTFFVIGPPIFIDKILDFLEQFHIPKKRIKKELLIPTVSLTVLQ